MTISALPLGYCTNVHPGRTLGEVLGGLERYSAAVRERVGRPIAAGLWLAAPVIQELRRDPSGLPRLREALSNHDLTCHTLNTFPYGDFHSARVKENVYLPDWSHPDRLEYTTACAEALAELLPEGAEGSLSTLPLGFKPAPRPDSFFTRCRDQLISVAESLGNLEDRTGRCLRLAIEPEPFCLLETTSEATAFFQDLYAEADRRGRGDAARRHLGLCYDVCHQAVEFEDAAEAIQSIDAAGVRIAKVQISCAIELAQPGRNLEAREALANFVEPRYLHQTMARTTSGAVLRAVDLTRDLALAPPDDFANADVWRVHFHVPVDAERIGPLGTTRAELKRALAAIAKLSYAPHLEVETYTWEVLPGQSVDIAGGIASEIAATDALLTDLR